MWFVGHGTLGEEEQLKKTEEQKKEKMSCVKRYERREN
jgi:hypothetical protein